MKSTWKTIRVASDGFVADSCLDEMYSHLPILVVYMYEGMYPTIEYIDKDNWSAAAMDFSKEACKYWMPCENLTED